MKAHSEMQDAGAARYMREGMRVAGSPLGKDYNEDRTLIVSDPFRQQPIGSVPKATVNDVRSAFEKAQAYRSRLSRYRRSEILERAALIVEQRRQELSWLISREAGLSLIDTAYEISRVVQVLKSGANIALQNEDRVFYCDVDHNETRRRVFTQHEPLAGVISAITPFNHPMNQVAHKVVPAVLTNNRIVVKPSEKTPLSALVLADIFYEAGLPEPMLSIVTGCPHEIGEEMIGNPHAALISFTGGIEVGKIIASKAGYRRIVLELGGNDPIIVMDDADLSKAAELTARGSYRNSGQRCTAIKRILVHEGVLAEFTHELVRKTEAWSFGDPLSPKVQMGTVIDEAAARTVETRINKAIEDGATLFAGGQRDGALIAPTVLGGVISEMDVVKYETFGPVSPVISFSDIDEAIAIANNSRYGLSSAVCTDRIGYISRFVEELQVGTVNFWEVPGFRLETTPFGGIKDSGLGIKEGLIEAARSFTNVKTYSLPF